jgi:membrane protein required for colicin V production
MNPLDWVLAVVVAYSVVRAAMLGFFRAAFSLGGLLIGFALACWNYHSVGARLTGLIASPPLAQFAAFVLILCACMVLANLLGRLLHRTASVVGLGFLDRLFGALFGLLRGALFGLAILLAITAFLPAAPWIKTSLCAPYFLRAAHAVSFVMPTDLQRRLLDGLEQIKHATPAWVQQELSR